MQIVHYNKACALNVYYNATTQSVDNISTPWDIGRSTFGRFACIWKGYKAQAHGKLNSCTAYSNPIPGTPVYISIGSKIPRDLIRNSGYVITRDIDKASYVIIPKTDSADTYQSYISMLTTDERFIQCGLYFHRSVTCPITEEVIDKIKEALIAEFGEGEFFYDDAPDKDKSKLYIEFFRKVPEYEDILSGRNTNRRYKFDDEIILSPQTTITPENLMVLFKMDSVENAMKVLMNSDFDKYPFTTCVFLSETLDVSYGYKYGDQVNWMMKRLHYDEWEDRSTFPDPISPDDFSMLQSWLHYKLGIKETGGFASMKSFDNLTSTEKDFLTYRVACKKVSISEPVILDTLKTTIENSR